MAKRKSTDELFDPRSGGQAIRLSDLRVNSKAFEPARTNYFTIYLIESGSGTLWADASRFAFGPSSLLFFVPYQHIRLLPDSPVQGDMIQFHANFLCVETFHAEVGCSGILFNDPYGIPVVPLHEEMKSKVLNLIADLRREQTERGLAFSEVMLAHLKVLLIIATRLKSFGAVVCGPAAHDHQHPVLIDLRDLIEENFCSLHTPADYAKLLHITPKTLGRIIRETLGTTPTELIRARILTHAKWQLLHTLRPVKEIAREVGFNDELYFSRFFKKATGHSPRSFGNSRQKSEAGAICPCFRPMRPFSIPMHSPILLH
jgi:AraC family transcriptional activator of pobA